MLIWEKQKSPLWDEVFPSKFDTPLRHLISQVYSYQDHTAEKKRYINSHDIDTEETGILCLTKMKNAGCQINPGNFKSRIYFRS